MLRPGADMGEVQFGKQSGYAALGIDDAKALLNHPLQINSPPADNAVDGRIRAGFDNLAKLLHLPIIQHTPPPRAFAVCQTSHSFFVEPVDPIAQRLAVHAADPRRIGPAHPVINRRQSQQPAKLARIAIRPGQSAQL